MQCYITVICCNTIFAWVTVVMDNDITGLFGQIFEAHTLFHRTPPFHPNEALPHNTIMLSEFNCVLLPFFCLPFTVFYSLRVNNLPLLYPSLLHCICVILEPTKTPQSVDCFCPNRLHQWGCGWPGWNFSSEVRSVTKSSIGTYGVHPLSRQWPSNQPTGGCIGGWSDQSADRKFLYSWGRGWSLGMSTYLHLISSPAVFSPL